MTVLIADDEEKVCKLVRNLVDWASFHMEIVGVVHDGDSAFAFIRENHPDIVITDIRMPGCAGIEMIRRVREVDARVYFIIISGYRQFEYANQAIKYGVEDYLLKPLKQKDIEKVLTRILHKEQVARATQAEREGLANRISLDAARIKGHLLRQLFDRNGASEYGFDVRRINEACHSDFADGPCMLLLFRNIGYSAPGQSKLFANKAESILENELAPMFIESAFAVTEDGVACLLNGTQEQFAQLAKALRRVENGISGALGDILGTHDFVIAMSAQAARFAQLGACVDQVRKALAQRIFAHGNTIAYSDACEPHLARDQVLDAKMRAEFRRDISAADLESLVGRMERLRDAVLAEDRVAGWDVYAVYRDMTELFVTVAKDTGMPLHDAFMQDVLREYGECRTAREAFACLSNRFAETLDTLRTEKNNQQSQPIRHACQYIYEHYAQPLTLASVGEEVGLNATYFSTCFKRETGQNFLDYLTEVRMEAARELLKNTAMPVGDVAETVGYCDLKYFYKRFKRSSGLGPKEYRKLYGRY